MRRRVSNRLLPLIALHECFHVCTGDATTQGIECDPPLPPRDRGPCVTSLRRGRRRLLEGAPVLRRQSLPLFFDPTLELRRLAQVDSVQERATVERGGVFEPTRSDRIVELHDIRLQHGRIQSEIGHADRNVIRADVATNDEKRLPQCIARPLLVTLRPEQR